MPHQEPVLTVVMLPAIGALRASGTSLQVQAVRLAWFEEGRSGVPSPAPPPHRVASGRVDVQDLPSRGADGVAFSAWWAVWLTIGEDPTGVWVTTNGPLSCSSQQRRS